MNNTHDLKERIYLLFLEAGNRLHDDKPFINWFNNELNNITETIEMQIEQFEPQNKEGFENHKQIAKDLLKLARLLEKFEVGFMRFDLLDNLIGDLSGMTIKDRLS